MSLVAMGWAWEQEVSSGAKLVLLALADRANEDDGTCWPGLKTVARKVGLSERVVRKHVESLEGDGLLRREVRTRADGSQTSNLIVLSMTGGAVTDDRGGRSPVTDRTEPTREPTSSAKLKKTAGAKILAAEEEPIGFSEWLGYHHRETGRSVPKAGTVTRSDLARAFAKLIAQGYGLEDFQAVTDYARLDPYWAGKDLSLAWHLRLAEFGERAESGRRLKASAPAPSVDAVDWSRFDG